MSGCCEWGRTSFPEAACCSTIGTVEENSSSCFPEIQPEQEREPGNPSLTEPT